MKIEYSSNKKTIELKYPLLAKDKVGNIYYMHNRKEGTCLVSVSEIRPVTIGKMFYCDAENMDILTEDEFVKITIDY